MGKITASIITIGDELLIGQVIDTNSAWIGQSLNQLGVWVQNRIAVGDTKKDILDAIDEQQNHSDILIITGGLGPTSDDITKAVLTEYFGAKLILHEPSLKNVERIFSTSNRPMLQSNINQALVPDNCTAILNNKGTAPGMFFDRNNKLIFSMPGVPHEMMAMMESFVLPLIQSRFTLPKISHRTLLVSGIGESFLAETLKEFEMNLPGSIKLAYLPAATTIRLRLSEQLLSEASLSLIDVHFSQLEKYVAPYLIANEDISMQAALAAKLINSNATLSTAESCTGGYIAHLFTSMPGASKYFYGSVVSYDNSIKEKVLKVKGDTLKSKGAVSEEVVSQMVENLLVMMDTDYGIAVSGILGPDGGTDEKPVGMVWIGVGHKKNNTVRLKTKLCQFHYDRKRNMEATANTAIRLLMQLLQEEL